MLYSKGGKSPIRGVPWASPTTLAKWLLGVFFAHLPCEIAEANFRRFQWSCPRFSSIFKPSAKREACSQMGFGIFLSWKRGKDPHPQDKIQHLDFTKDPRPLYHLSQNYYITARNFWTINFGRRNVKITSQKLFWDYFWAL